MTRRLDSFTEPLWKTNRVTREEHRILHGVAVDGAFLDRCAENNQALFLGECSNQIATRLIGDIAVKTTEGIVWVICASESAHSVLVDYAKKQVSRKTWPENLLVHDAHPHYKVEDQWPQTPTRLLAVTASALRSTNGSNPRKRARVLHQFVPLIVVFDPELLLCSKFHDFDPGWVVRDLISRLVAIQGPVPIAVISSRTPISINPTFTRTIIGVNAFIYLDFAP